MDERVLDPNGHASAFERAFGEHQWSLAMSAAWIIWRSQERVVHLLSEVADVDGRVSVFDVFNEAARREGPERGPPDGGALTFVEAQAELWESLKRGRLVARGIKVGEASWSSIAAPAWVGIDYFPCTGGQSNSIGSGGSVVYSDVTVLHSAVLEIWPSVPNSREAPVAGENPRRRGRPPVTDWTAIKDLLFEECKRQGGVPSLEIGAGWAVQADAEKFVRDMLDERCEDAASSTVRTHVGSMLNEYEADQGQ